MKLVCVSVILGVCVLQPAKAVMQTECLAGLQKQEDLAEE